PAGLGGVGPFLLAFNSSTRARVFSGSASASFLHPLQQTNTGRPLISNLTGGPIDPSRSSQTTHNSCASTTAPSAGVSLARSASTSSFGFSLPGGGSAARAGGVSAGRSARPAPPTRGRAGAPEGAAQTAPR